VDEDYRTQAAVCAKFNTWAQEYPEEYATAYVEDCIPMVIELYVRLDMLEWTPFQVRFTADAGQCYSFVLYRQYLCDNWLGSRLSSKAHIRILTN
jgi:hypothetical protein